VRSAAVSTCIGCQRGATGASCSRSPRSRAGARPLAPSSYAGFSTRSLLTLFLPRRPSSRYRRSYRWRTLPLNQRRAPRTSHPFLFPLALGRLLRVSPADPSLPASPHSSHRPRSTHWGDALGEGRAAVSHSHQRSRFGVSLLAPRPLRPRRADISSPTSCQTCRRSSYATSTTTRPTPAPLLDSSPAAPRRAPSSDPAAHPRSTFALARFKTLLVRSNGVKVAAARPSGSSYVPPSPFPPSLTLSRSARLTRSRSLSTPAGLVQLLVAQDLTSRSVVLYRLHLDLSPPIRRSSPPRRRPTCARRRSTAVLASRPPTSTSHLIASPSASASCPGAAISTRLRLPLLLRPLALVFVPADLPRHPLSAPPDDVDTLEVAFCSCCTAVGLLVRPTSPLPPSPTFAMWARLTRSPSLLSRRTRAPPSSLKDRPMGASPHRPCASIPRRSGRPSVFADLSTPTLDLVPQRPALSTLTSGVLTSVRPRLVRHRHRPPRLVGVFPSAAFPSSSRPRLSPPPPSSVSFSSRRLSTSSTRYTCSSQLLHGGRAPRAFRLFPLPPRLAFSERAQLTRSVPLVRRSRIAPLSHLDRRPGASPSRIGTSSCRRSGRLVPTSPCCQSRFPTCRLDVRRSRPDLALHQLSLAQSNPPGRRHRLPRVAVPGSSSTCSARPPLGPRLDSGLVALSEY